MVYFVFYEQKIHCASGARLLFSMFVPFLSFSDPALFLPWIRPWMKEITVLYRDDPRTEII